MKTKDRILDVAIKLFNEQGTSAVSTNHIAEAAGISPGNLYYHFSNKEEIIREIFERLFHLWDISFDLPRDRVPTLEDIQGVINTNFKLIQAYRFAYREILALLRQDPVLQARYITIRQRGYEGFREIIPVLVAVGTLQGPIDDDTALRLADLIWLISEFWLSEVEVEGKVIDDAQMQRGIELMMEVLRPYIRTED